MLCGAYQILLVTLMKHGHPLQEGLELATVSHQPIDKANRQDPEKRLSILYSMMQIKCTIRGKRWMALDQTNGVDIGPLNPKF